MKLFLEERIIFPSSIRLELGMLICNLEEEAGSKSIKTGETTL